MIIKFHWFPYLLDNAVFHDHDPVRHCHGFYLIVSNIYRSGSKLTMQFTDLCSHTYAELRVKIGKWFVHKKQLLIFYNSTSKGHSLTLASGKIFRFPVTVFFQPENLNRPVHFFLNLRRRHFHIFQSIPDILFHSHMRIQCVVLKNHSDSPVSGSDVVDFFSVYKKFSPCNFLKPRDHTESSRFSAAGGTDKSNEFFFLNIQIKVVHCVHF